MISFLKRELKTAGGKFEANVRFTGTEGSICLLIVDVDEIGFVYQMGGLWHCTPWHEITEIYQPIPEPDYGN